MIYYDPARHHRRSIRLRGYDYTAAAGYFITICTHDQEPIFGEIVGKRMRLNAFGEIAWAEWFNTAAVRPYVRLYGDEFVVMPNHVHGIIWIVGDDDDDGRGGRTSAGATRRVAPPNGADPITTGVVPATTRPNGPPPASIGAIIAQYKSIVTKRINEIRTTPGATVWQRNYYDHIIRNEEECCRIREYIVTNPLRWENDWENLNKTLDR